MWRLSGLTRRIYLLSRPAVHLRDVTVLPEALSTVSDPPTHLPAAPVHAAPGFQMYCEAALPEPASPRALPNVRSWSPCAGPHRAYPSSRACSRVLAPALPCPRIGLHWSHYSQAVPCLHPPCPLG